MKNSIVEKILDDGEITGNILEHRIPVIRSYINSLQDKLIEIEKQ